MNGIPGTNLGGWLSRGWNAFKIQPMPLILGSVILYLVQAPLLFSPEAISMGVWAVWAVIFLLPCPILMVGWCAQALKMVRGSQTSMSDLFSGFSRPGAAWGTCILVLLMEVGGMILCIIPGIILASIYFCSLFAVTDRQLSPVEAIRLSGRIAKGHIGKLIVVFLIGGVADALVMIPLASSSLKEQRGSMSVAIAVVIYLISAVVISPWIGAAFAAAYDSLVSKEQAPSVSEAAAPQGS